MGGKRAPGAAITVLYVEDEALARETVRSLLGRRFPEMVIHTAENGAQGLQLFGELRPDLVITDIAMPVMNGIEMARRILELQANVPIIVTSAHSDAAFLIECIEIGISRYVMKPIDSRKLFPAVDGCLTALRLERELRAQQAFVRKLSRAVEQSASGIVISDPLGVIEYVNPKFGMLTGYRQDEVLGLNLRQLQDTGEESWAAVAAGFEWHGEREGVKKGGEPYSESISISPVFDEQGQVTHLVTVKQDITEQKQSAREIAQLNLDLSARAAELEMANRDLEGFSYTVSHDLRSPLTNINGYCQLIQELYAEGLDEQFGRFIGIIFDETVAMGELIGTLLDFSRVARSELNRSRVDLSETAQVVAAGLMLRQPERCVDFRIAPDLAAEGDPELLRVVLENLLANAWKYTGKKERALIEFGVEAGGQQQVYFVRDDGAGFEMAQAERLFTAFQRLHSNSEFEGYGIGLATVQRVIQRHGGAIWAEGEVDKGATFRFTLPAADPQKSRLET
jgi:PAS domain S-box-containing protein